MEPEDIIKKYSEVAKDYDNKATDSGYTAYKKMALAVISELKLEDAKILDLGCGTGLSSVEFFKKGYDVTGIDITPGMIREAKKYPFKRLICQNLETELSAKDSEFDATVLLGVMEFIQDPLNLFLEVRRVLKEYGIFALTVPKKIDETSGLSFKSYSKEDIEQVFKESGFKIIRSEEFFGFRVWDSTDEIYYYGYVLRKI